MLQAAVANAGASRPDRIKDGSIKAPTRAAWYDASLNTANSAWRTPAQFTYGNGGRNILYGPGRVNLDFSIFKNFALTERFKLEYRSEFFNLTNTPQFGLPNSSIGSPAAGTIAGLSGPNRQIQMALRLAF